MAGCKPKGGGYTSAENLNILLNYKIRVSSVSLIKHNKRRPALLAGQKTVTTEHSTSCARRNQRQEAEEQQGFLARLHIKCDGAAPRSQWKERISRSSSQDEFISGQKELSYYFKKY